MNNENLDLAVKETINTSENCGILEGEKVNNLTNVQHQPEVVKTEIMQTSVATKNSMLDNIGKFAIASAFIIGVTYVGKLTVKGCIKLGHKIKAVWTSKKSKNKDTNTEDELGVVDPENCATESN